MKRVIGLGCVTAACLLGCDEPLRAVELVSDARLLGARVEVRGEPGRAAPAPGETATATFLVASPESSLSLGFALAACPAAAYGVGRAACAAEPFAFAQSQDGELPQPALTFETPASLDPNGRLNVIAIVCPGGSPSPDGTACVGAAPGTQVVLELELARAGDVNSNPELEPDAITFDGQGWLEASVMDGDCSGLGYLEVAAGSKHTIAIRLDADDRDALPRLQDADPPRESLRLSNFTTAGDLSRAFSSVSPEATELSQTVDWAAPNAAQLVRLWFVVRDLRGGSDYTERAVCVVP